MEMRIIIKRSHVQKLIFTVFHLFHDENPLVSTLLCASEQILSCTNFGSESLKMTLSYESETVSTTTHRCLQFIVMRDLGVCDLISGEKIRNYENKDWFCLWLNKILFPKFCLVCWGIFLRLLGFHFKICMKRHQAKKRLDGEKKIHAVLLSNNVFLELQHFEFAFLDSRHFLGTLNLGVSDHRCFMSFRLPGWTLSSKWKFPLMKNKSFGPLSSFAFLPIPFYGKKFV